MVPLYVEIEWAIVPLRCICKDQISILHIAPLSMAVECRRNYTHYSHFNPCLRNCRSLVVIALA